MRDVLELLGSNVAVGGSLAVVEVVADIPVTARRVLDGQPHNLVAAEVPKGSVPLPDWTPPIGVAGYCAAST